MRDYRLMGLPPLVTQKRRRQHKIKSYNDVLISADIE